MTPHYALVCESFGEQPLFTIRAQPAMPPGAGEIEVAVHASSINPIDRKRARGYGQRMLSLLGAGSVPLVLGNDFAGIVTGVGRSVNGFREGDRVAGVKPVSRCGTHATHVRVRPTQAFLAPRHAPFERIGVLPYSFTTAWRAIGDCGLNERNARNKSILIYGATGLVGMLAIRILHRWGAHVVAAGRANVERSLALGATEVIDLTRVAFSDLPCVFDATLNFATWADDAMLVQKLAPRATGHATTVHPMLDLVDTRGWVGGAIAIARTRRRSGASVPAHARYAWTLFKHDPKALAWLRELIEDDQIPSLEKEPFGLEQAGAAIADAPHSGKRAVILPHIDFGVSNANFRSRDL
jgi:reticulon-4-interacting protein 1, mitochondrial